MSDHILELMRDKHYSELRTLLADMHEADVADLFAEIEGRELRIRLFRLLPKDMAAEVFAYMEPDVQQAIIESITDVELKIILDDMFLDDCVDLIEEMPANVVERVLKATPADNRKLINQYLQYDEDSAGSLMTNEYIWFKRGITVAEALDLIRKYGIDKETIDICYVTAMDRKIEGEITLRQLVLADPAAQITDLMDDNVRYVYTTDDKEQIAKLFSHYDLLAMPVVDKEKRLVGIITIDDAVDVIQDENTEDFEVMAAMIPSDESYMKTPVVTLAKNRILWLLILMVSAMFTGALLQYYENAIAALPLLVSFIPMLMDTGGNGGAQASTMIIRGLALEEIKLSDVLVVWWKEARVSWLCGAVLSFANFVRILIQFHSDPHCVQIAGIVAVSLFCTLFIAKSLGCLMPMLAKKLKLDPALMASPIITTLTDACSILVFFNISTVVLGEALR